MSRVSPHQFLECLLRGWNKSYQPGSPGGLHCPGGTHQVSPCAPRHQQRPAQFSSFKAVIDKGSLVYAMFLGSWRPGLLSVNCMWWKPQLIQDKLRHWEPTPQQQSAWRCARQCHVTYAPKGRGNGHSRVTGTAFSQRPGSDSIQRRNQVLFRKTSGKHLDIP